MIGQLFRQMHAHSVETSSRTDVLKPLVYAMGILLTATVALVLGQAPGWLLVTTAALFVLTTTAYLLAFVFCLVSNPDLLRSETYGLNKMAIERGVFGDSQTGLVDTSEPSVVRPGPLIGTDAKNV